MKRSGWTLIELLAVMLVIAVTMATSKTVAATYGKWWGIGAGLLSGLLTVMLIIHLYRSGWRRDTRRLQKLREEYRAIYRVVNHRPDPEIVIMAVGAEIRIGDYGWEAGPIRNDAMTYLAGLCSSLPHVMVRGPIGNNELIYVQGLTPEWTVVWHAGFRPEQIEKVATKPNSQYDSWYPDWAEPPPLPPCPFPVVERETLTIGRPHHSHRYFVDPAPYPTEAAGGTVKDGKRGLSNR